MRFERIDYDAMIIGLAADRATPYAGSFVYGLLLAIWPLPRTKQ